MENELIRMSLRDFDTIQYLFTRFKFILQQLKACGITKRDDQIILSILSRLGSDYYVYVSTFCATKVAIWTTWNVASLDQFLSSLTHEKCILVLMGTLKASNAHALATEDGSKTDNNSK